MEAPPRSPFPGRPAPSPLADFPAATPDLAPRDPRAVVAAAFPHEGSTERQLYFMLNWAVRAPSVLNTQPWKFAVEGHLVRLYGDRSRQLRALDPQGRELATSCGAALCFLDVAARRFGYRTESYVQPVDGHPEVLGALLLTHPEPPTAEDEVLFEAIDARHTERAAFSDEPLSNEMVERLVAAAAADQVRLHVVTDDPTKEALADLAARGLVAQSSNTDITDEIRTWLRPNGLYQHDGVPDRVQTLWDRHAAFRIPIATLAEHRRALAAQAPALLVLATDTDDTAAWVRTGRALGRLLLTAAADSAAVSYLNQPVEVEALRSQLGQLVGEDYPQLLLRIGYGEPRESTPRRSVRDTLLRTSRQEWNWSMVEKT